MPSAHANLSPSAAKRWIACPASIQLAAKLPKGDDNGSVYAAEGTKAHELAELKTALSLGHITQRQFTGRYNRWLKAAELSDHDLADMHIHTDDYAALIMERKALHPNSVVLLEQRVFTGIEGCWGTSDAIIVSPVHVEIVDFKYGAGVPVSAAHNPQTMLYGVGALDEYGELLGDVETVYMTIHQPRLDSTSTWEIAADDLRTWRDGIIPIAADALAGSTTFGPSESACRWCPVSGLCPAQAEAVIGEAQAEFAKEPDLIPLDELGKLLAKIPEIKMWCAAVEARALDQAYSQGATIPGWKVVLSGGRRAITDEAAAIDLLVARGLAEDDVVTRKMKGLGDLEKLLKREAARLAEFVGAPAPKLEEVLPGLVVKGSGKPSLVPEADRRNAINPAASAAEDFTPVTEE